VSCTSVYLLYKKPFEPIVRPKDNVAILSPQRRWFYGKVIYVEPIQPQTISLGKIPAADPSNYPTLAGTYTLKDMQIGKHEFAQYRLFILDDYMLEVYLPAAVSRFNLKSGPTRISVKTPNNFTEIYVYEDNVPTVKYYSTVFRDIDNARLVFYGYRYVVQPLTTPPSEYTVIPATGVAPISP